MLPIIDQKFGTIETSNIPTSGLIESDTKENSPSIDAANAEKTYVSLLSRIYLLITGILDSFSFRCALYSGRTYSLSVVTNATTSSKEPSQYNILFLLELPEPQGTYKHTS